MSFSFIPWLYGKGSYGRYYDQPWDLNHLVLQPDGYPTRLRPGERSGFGHVPIPPLETPTPRKRKKKKPRAEPRVDIPVPVIPVTTTQTETEAPKENMYNPHVSVATKRPTIYVNLNPYGKGPRRGDRLRPGLEKVRKATEVLEWSRVYTHAAANKKAFISLPDQQLLRGDELSYSASTGRPLNFNSVYQLLSQRNNLYGSTFAYPGKNTNVATAFKEPILTENDAKNLVLLENQMMHMTLKNVTENQTGAGPVFDFSETPLDCVIYFLQAKENIYLEGTSSSQTNVLERSVEEAFERKYHETGTTQLGFSIEQPTYMTLGSIKEELEQNNLKVITSRRFILAPGQEVDVSVTLSKPQILSYQFLLDNKLGGFESGSSTDLRWNPVCYKKGEIMMMLMFKGGISTFDDLASVQHEKGRIAIKGTYKFTATGLNKDVTKDRAELNFLPAPTIQDRDLDAHHAQ